MPTPERVTIDTTVVRDYLDASRPRHDFAVALIELGRKGSVSIAIAESGHNYDLSKKPLGRLAEQLSEFVAEEGIQVLPQLSYLGCNTYPSQTLFPGAVVNGFPEAWIDMLSRWPRDKKRLDRKDPLGTKDRLHVETHLPHERDVFITDDEPVLTMCSLLSATGEWGIDAVGVEEYVRRYSEGRRYACQSFEPGFGSARNIVRSCGG